jgi:hypothetical protein
MKLAVLVVLVYRTGYWAGCPSLLTPMHAFMSS